MNARFLRSLGDSRSFEVHTGAIMPLPNSEPEVVFADEATTILQFKGIQGPNPFFGGKRLHVTFGRGGIYFNSWEALFTLEIDNATGTAVFSGDGDFRVKGGTGQFKNATGRYGVFFESEPTPLTSDTATADVKASGTINRRGRSRR